MWEASDLGKGISGNMRVVAQHRLRDRMQRLITLCSSRLTITR